MWLPRAVAAPKTPKAKAAFTAGVKAYQKGDYALASKQLERSFQLERDVETLFAWAQTERQLEHCDKASDLYHNILTFDLPDENKAAVQVRVKLNVPQDEEGRYLKPGMNARVTFLQPEAGAKP